MALLLWELASILIGSEVLITLIVMVIIWRHCQWSKHKSSHSSNMDKKSLHTVADDIILENLFSSDAKVEIGAPPSNHGSLRLSLGKSRLSNGLSPLPSLRETPSRQSLDNHKDYETPRESPAGRSPRVSPEHPKEFPQRSVSPLVLSEYPKTHHGMFIPRYLGRVSPEPVREQQPVQDTLSESPWSSVHDSSIGISFRESTSSISPAPYFRPNAIGESSKNSPVQDASRHSNVSSLRETLRLESPQGYHEQHLSNPLSMRRPTMGSESDSPYNLEIMGDSFSDFDDRGPGRVRFEPLWKGKYPDILPNQDTDGNFKYIKEINK